ncbi:hypothetical protein Dda_1462 [Drechslerella dactyloides]|uniref:AB hydrolase-1 domain-containing protein n=1 Tax=Drechslerella dactyloides TaxID=74499 RepID=A0AAD6J1S2_DREDA|nr:hypothetical protein Dda_1462 [Drechslerella dactyloides]
MGILSTLRLAVLAYAVVSNCAAVPTWADNVVDSERLELAARELHKRQDPPIDESSFLFETLTPSESIEWVGCYGTFQCTRLKVPLDYKDASKGSAAIAVIRLPASPEVPYKGVIYSHPGGYGNPSVPFFLGVAQIFRDYILEPGWEFVTWDARGSGQTTPTLTCFATGDERYAFEQRLKRLPPLDKTTWPQWQSYYRDYNSKCQALSGSVIPHIGFIQTTRDLVSLATAMGQSKINLWGFSNGANIGALLVALYPERVGKLMLDSVGKIHERFAPGTSVEFELRDHNRMLKYFFKACQSTGSTDGCAFYDSDSTCGKMTKRYAAIEKALAAHPIQMTAPQGTYNLENFKADVFGMISGGAGSPTYLWPFLATFLADVEKVTKGNPPGAALNQVYQQSLAPRYVSPPVNGRQQGPTDAQQGIPCTDSGPLVITQKQFETRLSSFNRKDPHFGTVFFQQYLACSVAIEWTGVNVEKLDFALLDKKTENVITFISHNIDPLCPIEGAKSMSRKFRNSRVITIDAVGHTQLLGPNSMPGYMQVHDVFNVPGYEADRGLVIGVDDAARPFGYTGSTFNV